MKKNFSFARSRSTAIQFAIKVICHMNFKLQFQLGSLFFWLRFLFNSKSEDDNFFLWIFCLKKKWQKASWKNEDDEMRENEITLYWYHFSNRKQIRFRMFVRMLWKVSKACNIRLDTFEKSWKCVQHHWTKSLVRRPIWLCCFFFFFLPCDCFSSSTSFCCAT